MLNKRIRSLIDEIFSDMRMTAENLALRDELMANAQARYEDAVAGGKSEEEAFAEVAGSLDDVQTLLRDMNKEPQKMQVVTGGDVRVDVDENSFTITCSDGEDDDDVEDEDEDNADEDEDGEDAADGPRVDVNVDMSDFDLGEALNKAFSAIGDFGRQLMPQAKKLVKQVDDATGGAIDDLGKAAQKGMREAQKAAEETIDRLSGMKGELVFDFGDPKGKHREEKTPEELRAQAKDIRAEAEIKQAVGDQEGARELRAKAYDLETQADALEQALAMEQARRDAEQSVSEASAAGSADDASGDGPSPDIGSYVDEEGEIDENAFAKAVDDMVREAQEAVDQGKRSAESRDEARCGSVAGEARYPAAGLRTVDVKVDADDVFVETADCAEVVVRWAGMDEANTPVVTVDGHTLCVRRPNPDVFKTFFSVFAKNGGQIAIYVPAGYAADYEISTTSGDVRLAGVDVDAVKVNSTSGDVRIEPDTRVRAKEIEVSTVSGDVTVSACAGDVSVSTVSGDQFISCDAGGVSVNTVSGDTHIEGACDEWEISTVSGDAKLVCTVVPTRRIQANTVSGDVTVALPGEIRGFVAELSGMSGNIVNEFGPNRYGTCALPIHMDTMSGNLSITRL